MTCLKLIAVLPFAFILVKVQTEECLTLDNKNGECIYLHTCYVLLEIAKQGSTGDELIEKSICGGTKFAPKVCCAFSSNVTKLDTINSTSSKNEGGKSKSLLVSRKFCGYQHSDDYFRQENDTSVRINEFPWLAHLLYKSQSTNEENYLCTGSLINNKYVLTAAHCIKNTVNIDLISVRLGEYYYTNQSDCVYEPPFDQECSVVEDYGIEETIPYPAYNYSVFEIDNIGLIRLNRSVVYTDYIRPICLPLPGETSVNIGDILTSAGWGLTLMGGHTELKGRSLIKIVSNDDCYKSYRINVTENHLCTLQWSTNDTDLLCTADSGGPAMFSRRFQWEQNGILIVTSRYCGKGPDIYTNVINYVTWIEENLEP